MGCVAIGQSKGKSVTWAASTGREEASLATLRMTAFESVKRALALGWITDGRSVYQYDVQFTRFSP